MFTLGKMVIPLLLAWGGDEAAVAPRRVVGFPVAPRALPRGVSVSVATAIASYFHLLLIQPSAGYRDDRDGGEREGDTTPPICQPAGINFSPRNPAGKWREKGERLSLDHVGREGFYGLLASLRGRLFRDADFAAFYCADNGRDSVPPSLLATALLLQSHDKVSDAEAKARADFDLRWKVALGIEAEDRPFAKSTLQVFRAQLILHDKAREVFESSLRLAWESGYPGLRRGRL